MSRGHKVTDRYQGLDEEEPEILKAFDEGRLRPIKAEDQLKYLSNKSFEKELKNILQDDAKLMQKLSES